MHPLITTWQRFSPTRFPRLLPEDKQLANQPGRALIYRSYENFITSADFGNTDCTQFHLGLLPQPFIGNLSKASIFILMLNPGFSVGDYYALQHSSAYASAIKRNLSQQNESDDFPFFFLDPQFAWTAGGQWWQTKLHSIATELMRLNVIKLPEALQHISQHVACLEMFPYHSRSFSPLKIELESKKLVCQYVKEVLVPRTQQGDALLVATRQAAAWPLPQRSNRNIITYNAGQARGAHLTMNTPGGQAILERLQRTWKAELSSSRKSGKALLPHSA
ncbi:hypothetical protein [Hymenobacter arizonensis]|uniref:Uncharacterized protein n=1 Tax=Hymenobacter arizonensis TaxID=1227077 RepID=A0A1I5YYE0_HYMAR|nr:hypothetical protein [Hymenobacter arizonensis]SFQ48857.1 hypothetical protein SAMN04515668_2517 [Hymenobacter arizonensis]